MTTSVMIKSDLRRFLGILAAALVLFGSVSMPLVAQDADRNRDDNSDGASLADLLRYASDQSSELQAAVADWQAAVERAPQARALPEPELGYGYFVERSTERLGMMGRQRLSLEQMFPAFGKRDLRAKVAERGAEVARERMEAIRLDVVERVIRTYSELAYIEETVAVFEEMNELLRQFEEVAMARFRSAEVGSSDVLRVQMEAGRVEDELTTLKEMRGPAAATLNAAAGRPAGAPIAVAHLEMTPWLDEHAERELEDWLRSNPNLRAREREIAQAEANVELAGRESWPDFGLGVEVIERSGERTEGMVMATIQLPIWRENYAAARREARAERSAAVHRHQSLQQNLEADLRMALFRVRDAERKMRLHGESLSPLARESYESLAGAYRAGEADFLDLLDAHRMVLDHERLHLRAMADHIQSLAELERLIGGRPGGALESNLNRQTSGDSEK